jgi:hypothetical protein
MTDKSLEPTISIVDAFDAMRHFLEAYWNRGGRESDDIAVLLGSLNRDEGSETPPLDPAMWDDWLAAVARTNDSRS